LGQKGLSHPKIVISVNQITMTHWRRLSFLSLLLAALTIGGCQTTTSGGAVGTDRKQLLLVSSQQLEQMAAQSYSKLTSEAAAKGTLNTDASMLRRLRAIAQRIEPQTKIFRPDAPDWKWEVNMINSSELNAFCMPGGKIIFYSGLIRQLNLTDEEIAVVMGHEISHALREHSREQVSQALAAQSAIGLGAALRCSALAKVLPTWQASCTSLLSQPASAGPMRTKPIEWVWNSQRGLVMTRAQGSRCGRKCSKPTVEAAPPNF
jgi:Zn-dependent protease with chaperone function